MPSEPRYPGGVSAPGNDACDDLKTRVPSAPVTRRPLGGENVGKRPHPSIPPFHDDVAQPLRPHAQENITVTLTPADPAKEVRLPKLIRNTPSPHGL